MELRNEEELKSNQKTEINAFVCAECKSYYLQTNEFIQYSSANQKLISEITYV